MKMVEKLARVAYENWIADVRDLEPAWDDLPQDHKERLAETQRAVLEALREPDERMLANGVAYRLGTRISSANTWPEDTRAVWQAMITAALED